MADRLVMALAGAAAEDAILGAVSTAAEADIGRATGIARQMVGRFGMSETVGSVRVLSFSDGRTGDEGLSFEPVSPATVAAFDAEVRRLVETAESRAKAIVGDNRAHLDALVAPLEVEEILERDALAQLLGPVVAAAPVATNGSPAPKRRRPAARATASATAEKPGQDPES